MKPSTPLLRRFPLIVAAIVGLALVASPARAQRISVCDCPDVFDLVNRLNLAQAAIDALNDEVPKIEADDRTNKRQSTLADRNSNGVTNQDVIRNAIIGKMGVVQLPGNTARAETNASCVSAIVSHGTACLDEVVMWHEDKVHVPACQRGPKTALGFRAPMATVAYAKEEIAGYTAEIERIKDILRSLPPTCRPSGWIGTIYYFETQQSETNIPHPGGPTVISGVKRSTHTLTRSANVLFKEGANATTVSAAVIRPQISANISETTSLYETTTGKVSCTGGLATPKFDGTGTSSTQDDVTLTAAEEKETDAGFSYDDQTGTYSVSFQFPAMSGGGTMTHTETMTSACPGDNGKTNVSSTVSMEYSSTWVNVSGTLTPTRPPPDRVQGTDKIEGMPQVTLPNMTVTGSGTVTWSFTRLP